MNSTTIPRRNKSATQFKVLENGNIAYRVGENGMTHLIFTSLYSVPQDKLDLIRRELLYYKDAALTKAVLKWFQATL